MTDTLPLEATEGSSKADRPFGDDAREVDVRKVRSIELGEEEAVKFNPRIDPRGRHSKQWPIEGGGNINGSGVAILRLGGDTTFTELSMVNVGTRSIGDGPSVPTVVLLKKKEDGSDTYSIIGEVDSGHNIDNFEPLELGRAMEDEEVADQFADTVSRVHCIVGLTRDGYIVVKNNNPTNMTKLVLT